MALFENITEFKKFISVNVSLDFTTIKPSIDEAEIKYIIPLIGQEQYDQLKDVYENGIGSSSGSGSGSSYTEDDNNALLEKVRRVLANFAMYIYVPIGELQMSAAGITRVESGDRKSAFQYQIKNLQRRFITSAYEWIEELLKFLDENKSTYTLWANSSAHADANEFFINSASDFNKHVNISKSRITFTELMATMRRVEDFQIKGILFDELFDEIKKQILEDDVSEENEKLLTFIRPAVAHLTLAEALDDLSAKITPDGILVSNNRFTQEIDQREPAMQDMINTKIKKAISNGENYLNQLRTYLRANVDEYPLYKGSNSYSEERSDKFTNNQDNGFYFAG